MPSTLTLGVFPPVQALNAGLFIARGRGIHPDRMIDSHELPANAFLPHSPIFDQEPDAARYYE